MQPSWLPVRASGYGWVTRAGNQEAGSQAMREPMREEWTLTYDMSAVPDGRARVLEAATAWGVEVDVDALALVTAELVSNAVSHGGPPIALSLAWDDRGLEVAVSDTEGSVPFKRDVPVDAEHGRGVTLVAGLSEDWGVTYLGSRKTVWAYLTATGPVEEPPAD
jgi:anti-sigma regulatory factor (Ser/Thr protein kinase)